MCSFLLEVRTLLYLAREDESVGHTEYVLKLRGNYMNDMICYYIMLIIEGLTAWI